MPRVPSLLHVAIGLAAIFIQACGMNDNRIEIDRTFSYNLIRVPRWYPGEEIRLDPMELDMLYRRGRPDFLRLWWNPDGSFVTSSDLYQQFNDMPTNLGAIKKTWIYAYDEVEIEFRNDGSIREHPLTEMVSLICKYGDPSLKNPPKADRRGRMKETWLWYDWGLKVEFLDGMEISRDHFTATGRGTILGK